MLRRSALLQQLSLNRTSLPLWQTTLAFRSGQTPKRSSSISASKTCLLPDGRLVYYVSKRDVAFLYREIFDKRAYLQHGIQLQKGDCVLDVGANIGLFAAYAASAVGHTGRVVALEPIPPVFEAALANMQSLASEGALERHLTCDLPLSLIQ